MLSLDVVRENDLCIACGACVAADPTLDLALEPTKLIYEQIGRAHV